MIIEPIVVCSKIKKTTEGIEFFFEDKETYGENISLKIRCHVDEDIIYKINEEYRITIE